MRFQKSGFIISSIFSPLLISVLKFLGEGGNPTSHFASPEYASAGSAQGNLKRCFPKYRNKDNFSCQAENSRPTPPTSDAIPHSDAPSLGKVANTSASAALSSLALENIPSVSKEVQSMELPFGKTQVRGLHTVQQLLQCLMER